jgi:hypothetical protein
MVLYFQADRRYKLDDPRSGSVVAGFFRQKQYDDVIAYAQKAFGYDLLFDERDYERTLGKVLDQEPDIGFFLRKPRHEGETPPYVPPLPPLPPRQWAVPHENANDNILTRSR